MKTGNVGYKIRNKKTGLYSKGGFSRGDRNFNVIGKTWKNLGHVKNHLHIYTDGEERDERLDDWEIVTFALVEIDKFDVNTLLGVRNMGQ